MSPRQHSLKLFPLGMMLLFAKSRNYLLSSKVIALTMLILLIFTGNQLYAKAYAVTSISVSSIQTGTLTCGTGGSATYAITLAESGNGNPSSTTTLNLNWISPSGVTFSPSTSVNLTGSGQTITLKLNTTNATPAGNYSFTVTESNRSNTSGNVNFVVNGPSAPTSVIPSSSLTICNGTSINLNATSVGNSINWYIAAVGGTLLGNSASGANFSVQPSTNTIYYAETKTPAGCLSAIRTATALVTVNDLPTPSFTVQPGSKACLGVNVTYTTQASMTSYVWGFPGILNTDYSITSGGTSSSSTVTLKWLTTGSKTVTINYNNTGGCSATSATSSTVTNVSIMTWTGSANTDWNNSGNWSCGTTPDLTTDVQIPNVTNKPILNSGAVGLVKNILIDSGASLTVAGNTIEIAGTITNNGTLTSSSGTVEMEGSLAQNISANTFSSNTLLNMIINNPSGVTLGGTLNVTGFVKITSGNLESGGYLTLVSTPSQTALIDGSGTGDVTGNVTMQRYLASGFGYKYFSSPFKDAIVGQFSSYVDLAASFPTFFRYDENRLSSGWVNYSNPSGSLVPLTGYAANFGTTSSPVIVNIQGLVNNKTLNLLSLTNSNKPYTLGFNLVGNPYPSPIDWDAATGWTKTNIDNAVYFFNASSDGGNFNANDTLKYQGTYSSYINGVRSGNGDNIIASMQGFFVHVSDGSYPVVASLGVTNAVRTTDLNPLFKSALIDSRSIFRIAANFDTGNVVEDPAVIYFDEMATLSFDKGKDALKMMNTDSRVPNLYVLSKDDKQLSISGMPYPVDSITRILLGLKTRMDGPVNFNVLNMDQMPAGMFVYLMDASTNVSQDLKFNPKYSTYLKAGNYENRFSLIFSLYELRPPTIMVSNEKFTISRPGGLLLVNLNLAADEKGILQLANMAGLVLYKKEVFGNDAIELNSHLSSGIYVISLISGNKISSKKIIIKKE
jgi:hypothetical protein